LRMGVVRRDEALAAARILGVSAENLVFLGYPDFGTLQIFESHWAERPAFRSYLTERRSVPYPHALRPGAPYKGESILEDLTHVLREFRPTKIFVSHPADHHPDHRALFLYLQVALWNERSAPEIFPYLVHHAGWPVPDGYHPELQLEPPADLSEVKRWTRSDLPAEAVAQKLQALKAHKTQYEYSAPALSSFVRTNELFGAIPPLHAATQVGPDGDTASLSTNVPAALLESERARFISVALTEIASKPGSIEFTLRINRWHAGSVVSLFLFPYSPAREFSSMPKLHLRMTQESRDWLDQGTRLPEDAVQLTREGTGLRLRVPTATWQGADRLLVAAHTQLEFVPLDWTPWRVVELQSSAEQGPGH
jgi:LmbE family N-acetylglucosaminyl deacetylase